MKISKCRFCNSPFFDESFALGKVPLANDYSDGVEKKRYWLEVVMCSGCNLLQHNLAVSPSLLFTDYAYFSSVSSAWNSHCKNFVESLLSNRDRPPNYVLEIASNDGYLLKHFLPAGVNVLGVEPAKNLAEEAVRAGIETINDFFSLSVSESIKQEYGQADVLIANNVLAHVPDLKNVLEGVRNLLSPTGRFYCEFPSFLELFKSGSFDTIYHEHFYYFTVTSFSSICEMLGLKVLDVERLSTHGGSLRFEIGHLENSRTIEVGQTYKTLINLEKVYGVCEGDALAKLTEKSSYKIGEFRNFIDECAREGRVVAAIGAAAKGNTFLNSCGILSDKQIKFIIDETPKKQGHVFPGTDIQIYGIGSLSPHELGGITDLVVLPWNHFQEIVGRYRGYFNLEVRWHKFFDLEVDEGVNG